MALTTQRSLEKKTQNLKNKCTYFKLSIVRGFKLEIGQIWCSLNITEQFNKEIHCTVH